MSDTSPQETSAPDDRVIPEAGILLARQPIFDARLELTAYELLHRCIHAAEARVIDGDDASSRILQTALEHGGFHSLTGGKPAYVNFTEHLIINPPPLDPTHIVVELLEDIRPTWAVLQGLDRLRESGFRIALDDFRYHESLDPLLERAHIVKLDVLDLGDNGLRENVRQLRNHPVKLLAEKIESWETFNHCIDLGFALFQGFFLARPQTVRGEYRLAGHADPSGLLGAITGSALEGEALVNSVSRDPLLSRNLIRLLESPLFGPASGAATLRELLLRHGAERMRGGCMLLVMARMREQPRELVRLALLRARFCELLGLVAVSLSEELAAWHFNLGLVSVLDAVFEAAPRQGDTVASLFARMRSERPESSGLLETTLAYERGDFAGVPWLQLASAGITGRSVELAYLESARWADDALELLPHPAAQP